MGFLLTLGFILCCLVLLLVFKSIWMIIFVIILFALFTIASREEADKELKEKEEEEKKEEILDERYPNPFLNSAVMFSDPKWSGSVRYGDALMTDLMQHLLVKLRDLDEIYKKEKEPSKNMSKMMSDLSKSVSDIIEEKKKDEKED